MHPLTSCHRATIEGAEKKPSKLTEGGGQPLSPSHPSHPNILGRVKHHCGIELMNEGHIVVALSSHEMLQAQNPTHLNSSPKIVNLLHKLVEVDPSHWANWRFTGELEINLTIQPCHLCAEELGIILVSPIGQLTAPLAKACLVEI